MMLWGKAKSWNSSERRKASETMREASAWSGSLSCACMLCLVSLWGLRRGHRQNVSVPRSPATAPPLPFRESRSAQETWEAPHDPYPSLGWIVNDRNFKVARAALLFPILDGEEEEDHRRHQADGGNRSDG